MIDGSGSVIRALSLFNFHRRLIRYRGSLLRQAAAAVSI